MPVQILYNKPMRHFIISYYPFVLPALLYLPFIFLGYGSWFDIYLVIDSGKNFLETGVWIPSRNPGYFVHEFFTMILNYLGGGILGNLGTVIMALLAIYGFILICKKFEVPHYKTLALIMAVNPIFWVNAVSTIDHIWAIGFILTGFFLLVQKKYPLGGLLLALSVGSRLSSVIAAVGIFVFLWFTAKNDRKLIALSALLCAFVSCLFYAPSFINANYTLNFLSLAMGGPELWTLFLRLSRFCYKNIYLWGLPAFIALIPIFFIFIRNRQNFLQEKWRAVSYLSLTMLIGYETLYFQYPLKTAYLLPLLPFALILLGIGLKNNLKILILFTALLFSYNFINFNVAQPDIPGQASGAKFKFTIENGYLLRDIKERLIFYKAGCDSIRCAERAYQNSR